MVKVLTLVFLLAITGCTTVKGDFCALAKPQRPSQAEIEAMTDARVAEVLAHNRRGQELCGWHP